VLAAMSLFTLLGAWVVTAGSARADVPVPSGWTQNFLDEFNGGGLSGNWRVSEGTSYPGGPGNFGTGEVEVSSRNNVSTTNGIMSITARGGGMGPWTAARIETNRQDFQPPAGGKLRVEASLRLPEAPNGQSAGYWPAFWMLGAPYRGNWWNWPSVGEFDIMEQVNGANRTWQTMHCGTSPQGPCNEKSGIGNGGPGGCAPTACTKGFHKYTLDWSRADNSATWYVDGRQVHRTSRGGNIPANVWDEATNHGFFIILNIAMGGEMPCNTLGCLNGATGGGGHLDADYVAVYTGGANAPPPGQGVPGGPTTPPQQPPPTCGPLVSRGRPATSSAIEAGGNYSAAMAVDGNMGTRWSSAWSDPQWMQVDLGSVQPVTRVKLDWETAYGSAYQIQTSTNGSTWTNAYTEYAGDGGTDDLKVTANARYVRLTGTQRATTYGYSLWEFSVYGACPGGSVPTTPPPGGGTTPPDNPPPGSTTWAPNTAYAVGQQVTYAGVSYRCLQAHTSIVSWEPPNAPALWQRL
jgi:beta-glucanase (GH16 family)